MNRARKEPLLLSKDPAYDIRPLGSAASSSGSSALSLGLGTGITDVRAVDL
eukprot:CAMPEP_0175788948 /NCGR_PEP_ID=MMETSP0097-20121207/81148_1 /TAXON_ID=311494 /ORGANISM="Alexandrium monilatum, Strain CCMP3105" /LENGTH=50 /DNA_ID=CAMNT_0017099989 /DNA_START=61 /DNA_END=209 /DNA_ORIENTATION=-